MIKKPWRPRIRTRIGGGIWVVSWGMPTKRKYLEVSYFKEWRKGDYKKFHFQRTSLGWATNVGKLSISYDNYRKTRK